MSSLALVGTINIATAGLCFGISSLAFAGASHPLRIGLCFGMSSLAVGERFRNLPRILTTGLGLKQTVEPLDLQRLLKGTFITPR
eukprot:3153406-Amphidinium_carterae.3